MSSSDGQKIVTPESIVAEYVECHWVLYESHLPSYKASGQFDKLKADLQSQFMSDVRFQMPIFSGCDLMSAQAIRRRLAKSNREHCSNTRSER